MIHDIVYLLSYISHNHSYLLRYYTQYYVLLVVIVIVLYIWRGDHNTLFISILMYCYFVVMHYNNYN